MRRPEMEAFNACQADCEGQSEEPGIGLQYGWAAEYIVCGANSAMKMAYIHVVTIMTSLVGRRFSRVVLKETWTLSMP